MCTEKLLDILLMKKLVKIVEINKNTTLYATRNYGKHVMITSNEWQYEFNFVNTKHVCIHKWGNSTLKKESEEYQEYFKEKIIDFCNALKL
jgi:hypothetical protein